MRASTIDRSPAPVHRAVLWVALAAFAFHVATATGYGIFRDELYYLACGRHLAFGYVDHPPLVALVARLVASTLGTSLHALRLVPALALGATAWLTGAIAAELGGDKRAQITAAIAVVCAPVGMAFASYLSMNALELALWTLAFLLFARALRTGAAASFAVLGVVLGVALENKIGTLYLGLGLALGLVVARRDLLRTRGPWLAALIAGLLFLPHLLWQIRNDYPTLEFMHNARLYKMAALSPPAWLGEQLLEQNPLAAPLWLVGLVASSRRRATRPLAVAFLTIIAVLLSANGKPYYAAAAYAPLFAAGACALAPRALMGALAMIGLGGLLTMPLAKPILPVPAFVRYQAALGLTPTGAAERHRLGVLPQFFADMHGWPELARTVASVHAALPPNERDEACIFAQNYGQAGAIDLFGPALGLPPASSGHNNYFLWGWHGCTGETVIVIGGDEDTLRSRFDRIERVAVHACPLCMPFEANKPIFVGHHLREPLERAWPHMKHYQ